VVFSRQRPFLSGHHRDLCRRAREARKLLNTGVEWWRELASGFTYAFGFTGTRRLLLLLMAVGFFTAPWSSLMPIFAAETFSGDSRTFGFLIGAVGLVAIAGTFALAARGSVRGLGRVVASTRGRLRPGSKNLGASREARLPQAGNHPATTGVGCNQDTRSNESSVTSSS